MQNSKKCISGKRRSWKLLNNTLAEVVELGGQLLVNRLFKSTTALGDPKEREDMF